MPDNYEHYISKNIQAFYRRRLFSPMIYLVLLAVLWIVFPLGAMLRPAQLSDNTKIADAYKNHHRYVRMTFTDLKFSGYTCETYGQTRGYYYYTTQKNNCSIILLTPHTCEEGLPTIDRLTVTGRIVKGKESYLALLSQLSSDLNWTETGIRNQLSSYYFSEPDYHLTTTRILFFAYFGSMIYTVLYLLICMVYIRFPVLSPPCQNLIVFGHPGQILAEAEEELATLPQLATEDMFITEHYFIMTSPYGNAIVPIQEILWIYKHSTLHKMLWYHFSISYTMHITANKHMYVNCPKNTKSDIDGIMDYLAEANHNILVGFNEENRLKVQAVQGKPFHIENFMRYCAAASKTYRLCFRFHNPDFHRLPLPREAFLFLPAVIHVQKVSLYSPQSVQYHRYQIHTLTFSSTAGAALHPSWETFPAEVCDRFPVNLLSPVLLLSQSPAAALRRYADSGL